MTNDTMTRKGTITEKVVY